MMKRHGLIVSLTVFAVGLVGRSSADPVLLADFEAQGGGALAPQRDPRVQFILEIHAHDSFPPGPRLGDGYFWVDGESGVLEFTFESDTAFQELTSLATDGFDDHFSVYTLYADGMGGGGGGFESRLFSQRRYETDFPDLMGFEIALIRLTVDNVAITPWSVGEVDGFQVAADLRYEFYGNPIPEPATCFFVAIGLLIVISKRAWTTILL